VIGRQRALQLIMTGRALSAIEAEAIGLVDRIVLSDPESASEAALKGARAMAEEILRGGPVAVNMALKAVMGWKDGGKSEAEGYELTLQTEDRLAALRAFKEKGTAKYTGS
jgi:methylglutaconyl-CoA hydratase